MSKNKLLPFFSSDDIALPLLTKLREKFELLVITKTDKPQGRSLKTAANDIAAFCEKNKINLWKIEKIDQEVINRLTNYDFDLGVCFAFGLFLPADLLNLFAGRLINIHPSALPQYRGASPLQASLLHDDKQTALSYILMTLKLDSGPLLGQFPLTISPTDNYQSLATKISQLAALTGPDLLADFAAEKLIPQPQVENAASNCPLIEKGDGQINWSKTAREIFNQWRAYHLWPGLYTTWQSKKITFLEIDYCPKISAHPAGMIFNQEGRFFLAARDGVLEIKSIQLAGKNKMPVKDFINGHPNFVGAQLI